VKETIGKGRIFAGLLVLAAAVFERKPGLSGRSFSIEAQRRIRYETGAMKRIVPAVTRTTGLRDHGKGLPVDSLEGKKLGVGIAGMRERIRQFGGELTVTRGEPGTW